MALADPDGFTLTPGTAGAYVTPAERDHGGPPVAALVGAAAAVVIAPNPDIPPHLPAPIPNPSPDHAQVHVSKTEWAALIKDRWERNQASKNKKFTFMQKHHMTEFHVAGDPFTYRVGADGKMAAVYDTQLQKSYNVTGTRKGLLRIPLTLTGEPTYAGTPHMYPVAPGQKNVVQIKKAGSRGGDFKAANEAAGLMDLVASQGRRPERAPEGYT